MPNVRAEIAQTALWGVAHHARSFYTEGAQRGDSYNRPFELPFYADCSFAFEDWYHWNHAPSPAGKSGVVYTGTELTTGEHIALFHRNAKGIEIDNVLPADGVVFGPGTGFHIAMIVARRADLDHLCVSHGTQGDPQLISLSSLTEGLVSFWGPSARETTFLRFNTNAPSLVKKITNKLRKPNLAYDIS